MLNPLRSEADAFRVFLYCVGVAIAIIIVVAIVNLLA
jgi:hypothetical protein